MTCTDSSFEISGMNCALRMFQLVSATYDMQRIAEQRVRRTTVSNHANFLPTQHHIMPPPRRMKQNALKALPPFHILRPRRRTQPTRSANDQLRLLCPHLPTLHIRQRQHVYLAFAIPCRAVDGRVKADVRPEVVFAGEGVPVGEYFWL